MNAIINLLIWVASVTIAFSVVQIGFHFAGLNSNAGWKKLASTITKVFITLLLWPHTITILLALIGMSGTGWQWLKIFLAIAFVAVGAFVIIRNSKNKVRDAVVMPVTAIINSFAVCTILSIFGYETTAEIGGSLTSWLPTLIMISLLSWLSVGFERPVFFSRLISWGMACITIIITLVCADLIYLQAHGELTKIVVVMQQQTVKALEKVNKEAEGRRYDEFEAAKKIFTAAETIYNANPTDENFDRWQKTAERLNAIKNKPVDKIRSSLPPAINEQTTVINQVAKAINKDGLVGASVKAGWKIAFGNGSTSVSSPTSQPESPPITIKCEETVDAIAIPNKTTVYFESNKAFYVVERNGVNNDGSETLTNIKMPPGKSKRFFTWGGVVKIQGIFDDTKIKITF